jgi:hypothetical protein
MSGEHHADSWIDVKGDNYTIEDNTGNHSLLDGIQVCFIIALFYFLNLKFLLFVSNFI